MRCPEGYVGPHLRENVFTVTHLRKLLSNVNIGPYSVKNKA